ncbi:MAG: hypothetical protein ACOC93_06945, partial [Planctomycetota bacterium]
TGQAARDNGLIDELGGMDRAVALAKELTHIPAEKPVRLIEQPPRRGMLAQIRGGDDQLRLSSLPPALCEVAELLDALNPQPRGWLTMPPIWHGMV